MSINSKDHEEILRGRSRMWLKAQSGGWQIIEWKAADMMKQLLYISLYFLRPNSRYSLATWLNAVEILIQFDLMFRYGFGNWTFLSISKAWLSLHLSLFFFLSFSSSLLLSLFPSLLSLTWSCYMLSQRLHSQFSILCLSGRDFLSFCIISPPFPS